MLVATAIQVPVLIDVESFYGLVAHDNALTAKTHRMLGGWR